MPRLLISAAVIIALFAAACSPPPRQAALPLPTPTLPPSDYPLEDAERTARLYLEAWRRGDFAGMYNLLSFASQEANPFDDFRALYDDSYATMTFEALSFRPVTILRDESNRSLATFHYDVTFSTRMLGDFTDSGRSLWLVADARNAAWRVAWSARDIFAQMADGGRLRLDPTVPNRANIYDRDGSVLADQNGRVVTVNVTRAQIPEYTDCLNALSAALAEPVADIQARLEARPPDWLIELGIIEAQTYQATHTALETFCDAGFNNRPARRYATPHLAPHILGYVGYPSAAEIPALEAAGFAQDSIIGRSGLEASWDETLRGQPAARLLIVTPNGQVVRELARSSARPGESIWLTFDADFQAQAQQIIADAYTIAKDGWALESLGAAAVVMDVRTGAILAMVSYPTFDNNAYTPFPVMGREAADEIIRETQADPANPEVNRAVQGTYPLGSVMKTVSAAAAADSGVYALDERYTCTGIWDRDITRYDWLPQGHGTVDLAESLTTSCNPYYYEVGYHLSQTDPWLLPNYARQLGFGGPTGMTDLAEAQGLIGDPEWLRVNYGATWTFSEAVNMSIGQGYLDVTPLQVVRWFAAIANGGTLPHPHLVGQVGLIGETLRPAPVGAGTPTNLRPDVIATVRQGICAVTTSPVGTAVFVFDGSPLQTIGVCGKTGTAQNPQGTSHAWFAAYAPRDNPEIAVVAIIENSGEGSGVAAPIVRDLLEAYFGLD
ncbi:MAG: hypothetical protein GYB67_05165 [Chloroflexi bacterium]|nr:hypothetical protein [Chloroflexota bacterium]